MIFLEKIKKNKKELYNNQINFVLIYKMSLQKLIQLTQ